MPGPHDTHDLTEADPLSAASLDALVADALAAFAAASGVAALKEARLAHAGERSPIALANRAIGRLTPAERKDAGRRIGMARGAINGALAERQAIVEAAELERALSEESVDVTLPVALAPEGAIHPITGLIDLMSDVFVAMGWEVAEGPEAEAEWLNFDALNIGADHPARGESDTLFVAPVGSHRVLRTHTSPVQIRSLLNRELPVYVVCPGKVYRADEFEPRTSRCSTRSRACASTRESPWRISEARSTIWRARCSATSGRGSARTTSRSPSPAPRWTWSASPVTGPPSVTRTPPAAPAAARAGSSGAGAAW